jgi:hypothetical protein
MKEKRLVFRSTQEMEVEKVNSSTDLKHGSASDIDVECTIPDAFEVNELNTQKTID